MANDGDTGGATPPAKPPEGAKPDGDPPKPPEGAKPEDALGDEGKRALASERAARATAEREAREAKAELDKLREDAKSEQDKALDAARKEGNTEATKLANTRLVRAEVKAAAGGKLQDPADAPRHIDLAQFSVDDDGNVDDKAIAAAIDALVKEKPYLAAKASRPSGDGGGGPRGTDGEGKPPSMDDWLRQQAGIK